MSGIIEVTNLQTANIKSTSGNTAITVDANGNTTVGGTATFSNPPVNVGVSNLQYFQLMVMSLSSSVMLQLLAIVMDMIQKTLKE